MDELSTKPSPPELSTSTVQYNLGPAHLSAMVSPAHVLHQQFLTSQRNTVGQLPRPSTVALPPGMSVSVANNIPMAIVPSPLAPAPLLSQQQPNTRAQETTQVDLILEFLKSKLPNQIQFFNALCVDFEEKEKAIYLSLFEIFSVQKCENTNKYLEMMFHQLFNDESRSNKFNAWSQKNKDFLGQKLSTRNAGSGPYATELYYDQICRMMVDFHTQVLANKPSIIQNLMKLGSFTMPSCGSFFQFIEDFLCAIRRCMLTKRIELAPEEKTVNLGLASGSEYYFEQTEDAEAFSKKFFDIIYSNGEIEGIKRERLKGHVREQGEQKESANKFSSRCMILLLVNLIDKKNPSISKKVCLVSISGESQKLSNSLQSIVQDKLSQPNLDGYEIRFLEKVRNVDKEFIKTKYKIDEKKRKQSAIENQGEGHDGPATKRVKLENGSSSSSNNSKDVLNKDSVGLSTDVKDAKSTPSKNSKSEKRSGKHKHKNKNKHKNKQNTEKKDEMNHDRLCAEKPLIIELLKYVQNSSLQIIGGSTVELRANPYRADEECTGGKFFYRKLQLTSGYLECWKCCLSCQGNKPTLIHYLNTLAIITKDPTCGFVQSGSLSLPPEKMTVDSVPVDNKATDMETNNLLPQSALTVLKPMSSTATSNLSSVTLCDGLESGATPMVGCNPLTLPSLSQINGAGGPAFFQCRDIAMKASASPTPHRYQIRLSSR